MALIRQPPGLVASAAQTGAAGPGRGMRMQPVYFNGCLGWYHAPPGQAAALGVVICPALGREARWTYRGVRQLADRIAEAGLPVLRFELPGTGDSAEIPEWEEKLSAWRESVHAACDWLRAQTGLDHLALAGVRFGALLAADVAAARGDVAALALIGPVLSGRNYARELRLAAIGGEGDAAPENGIELDATLLPEASLAAISAIDLMNAAAAPAPQVLMLDNSPRGTLYAERLMALGAETTRLAFPGYDQFMRVATSNLVPHAAWSSVAGWFEALGKAAGPLDAGLGRPLPAETSLQCDFWRERALLFGPADSLAGVLCEPAPDRATGRAVIIPNTGGDPRAGIGRFSVRLARRLAAHGIASLRFDFAGLGDSRLADDADGHLYETDRSADIHEALNLLEAHGYASLSAAGICTGAYHLLRAAATEQRLDALMAVNLVTFDWQAGGTVEVAQRGMGRSNARYWELLMQRSTWRRLFRGEVHARHVGGTLLRRGGERVMGSLARWAAPLGVRSRLDAPRRAMRALLGRGTRVLMVTAFDDPGIAPLEANFGRGGRLLSAMPGGAVKIERGIDHTLSRRAMQDQVSAIITGFLEAPATRR